jgi:hypothetical protein
MSDDEAISRLQRFKREGKGPSLAAQFDESEQEADETVEEGKCFSRLLGIRGRLLKLDVRFKNGDRKGLDYSCFTHMEFDASGELVLEFSGSGRKLTVEGARLGVIYEGFLDHAIKYLRELDQDTDQVPDGEPFITALKIEPLKSANEQNYRDVAL